MSVFFGDSPVVDFASARATETWRFPAFFHALLDAGVYAPPSAFENWFVSTALDDGAFERIAEALPAAARAGRRSEARMSGIRTTVHVMRHGEVHNPEGILYGRLPDYHLSERGRAQAEGGRGAGRPRHRRRHRITARSGAGDGDAGRRAAHNLVIDTNTDLIESTNIFEGQACFAGDGALRDPRNWKYLINPIRPSWGEPYRKSRPGCGGRSTRLV